MKGFDVYTLSSRDIDNGHVNSANGFDHMRFDTLVIPGDKNIVAIDDEAFRGTGGRLEHVEVGKSVETIGNSAFEGCLYMKTIEFEEGSKLHTIGERAFCMCENLPEFHCPDSCKVIEGGAFMFSDIKQIDLGQVERIDGYAFYQCSDINNVVIPSSVQEVGTYVFAKCDSLDNVIILGDEPKTFKDGAFDMTRSDLVVQVESDVLRAQLEQQFPDVKFSPLEHTVATDIEVHKLSDLINDNKVMMDGKDVLLFDPRVTGQLVVDIPDVKFEKGVLSLANFESIEASESYKEEIVKSGKVFQPADIGENVNDKSNDDVLDV